MIRQQVLAAANVSTLVVDGNPGRGFLLLQNLGPGNVAIQKRDLANLNEGIRIFPNGSVTDTPPRNHLGRWYAITDLAGTRLTVQEE